MTDEHPPPLTLVLSAQAQAGAAVIELVLRPGRPGDDGFSTDADYRPLQRADVEALAAASVGLQAQGTGWRLRLPWAQPLPD